MDGPLLQRALGFKHTGNATHTNRTIPISPSPFVQGSTGILADHETFPTLYHPLFAKVLQQYTDRDPIRFPENLCVGSCELEIIAPGWDIQCTKFQEPYRLATYYDAEDYFNSQEKNMTYHVPRITQTVFHVQNEYNWSDVGYSADTGVLSW